MDRRAHAGYIPQSMNSELRPEPDAANRRQQAPRRRCGRPLTLPIALALVLAVLAPTAPVAAQQTPHSVEEIAESRDGVLSSGHYQTEKPEAEAPPKTEPLRIPPWLVKTLLWSAGVVVAALIAYFLFNLARELVGSRLGLKRSRKERAVETARVETVPPAEREAEHRTLAEADALAAEGRFSEAIHLLLLVAMERLRGELGPRVAPAMTGREILRLSPIPEIASAPLARMVALSEIKHFGGRSASEPDYRICREDFLRFNGMAPA